MIKEPAYGSLGPRDSHVHLKGEFLLLIFIIIFGMIGIGICLGLSDNDSPEKTGMSPSISTESTI